MSNKLWLFLVINILSLVIGLVNTLFLGLNSLALISSLLFIWTGSYFLKISLKINRFLSVAVFLSMISIIFSFFYYIANFTLLPVIAILILMMTSLFIIAMKSGQDADLVIDNDLMKCGDFMKRNYRKSLPLLGLIITWVLLIGNYSIDEATRSPFNIIPSSVFIVVFLIILALALFQLNDKLADKYNLIILGLSLTSLIAVFAISYPLGYGFDPFIHRATLDHIVEFGTITPKPLYYTGEYVLELIARIIFGWSGFTINTWLTPVLTGLIIMTGLAIWKDELGVKSNWFYLAGFMLPLADFTYTTPQSLSYLFTWLTFSATFFADKKYIYRVLAYIFAITSLLMHPLAGIPAFLAIMIIDWPRMLKNKYRHLLRVMIFALCTISIPAAFALQARLSGLDLSIGFSAENNLQILNFDRYFNPWLDIFYTINGLYTLLFVLLAVFGLIYWKKYINDSEISHRYILMICLPAVLIINFIILNYFIQFSFLVEYERQNYTNRLIILIALSLLPLLGLAISTIGERFKIRPGHKVAGVLAISILILTNIYSAYPQDDGVRRSAGFNVSANDIRAVQAINEQNTGEIDYVVLANQNVSVAALQEFGFLHYFNNDTFYYPIPTGGKLYSLYLEMTEKRPSLEIIERVKEMTGAETVYFVVNSYWWDANRVSELAKQLTDEWFSIGYDEEIIIFKF